MKKILLLIAVISTFCTPTHSQTKNDAEFNLIRKEYTMNKDGSIDYNYRKELKLISNSSFFSVYGETFIVYNPDFQTLKINEAYVLRADGSKVETPANAFNEVLPSNCANCARYNNMKEMVVTHTALEYNATIVLDYTIHSTPGFITDLSDIVEFVEYSPIKNYEVIVNIPKTKELKERMLNLRLGATVTENDNFKVYRWTVKNIKESTSEAYAQNKYEMYPILTFSTSKDMTMTYFHFVDQAALRQTKLPECKELLKDLMITKTSFTNILAVRDYVVDNVTTNDISLKYNNYILAPASAVWKSNCGNEAEKALLMLAMFTEAGYQSSLVGFVNTLMHSDAVGCLDVIEHWGVRVFVDGQTYILSPISKSNVSMDVEYQNFTVYTFDSAVESFRVNATKTVERSINIVGNFTIDVVENSTGKMKCSISSPSMPAFAIMKDDTKAGSLLKDIKGTADNVRMYEQNVTFQYNVESLKVNDLKKDYYSFTLPETRFGTNINPSYLASKRKNAVKCNKIEEQYVYSIIIPDDCSYVGKDVSIIEEYPFGKVSIFINVEENTISVNRNLSITSEIIPVNEYKDFRNMIVLWNNDAYKTFIIKK